MTFGKTLGLAVLAMIVLPVIGQAQELACTPTTQIAVQHRSTMKHRAPGDTGTSEQTTTVTKMLAWSAPTGIADSKTRRSNEPIDDREKQVYTLEGDLWRVIVEDNDCDFHFELTTPGHSKTAPRVIVEIPQGLAYASTRENIIQELTANGYSLSVGKSITMDEPLRVSVTGYAFYDSAHYSKKNPQKGHSHGTAYVGTLWELHPVWKVAFASP